MTFLSCLIILLSLSSPPFCNEWFILCYQQTQRHLVVSKPRGTIAREVVGIYLLNIRRNSRNKRIGINVSHRCKLFHHFFFFFVIVLYCPHINQCFGLTGGDFNTLMTQAPYNSFSQHLFNGIYNYHY